MRTASPITITRDAPAGSEQVTLIELDAAVALLKNFVIMPGTPHHAAVAQTNYARAKAVVAMVAWGVPAHELGLA